MNSTFQTAPGNSAFSAIRFDDTPGFEVSWAGSHPFLAGFCFGSEDGRLLFTDESGTALGETIVGSESGEAVNGFTSHGDNIVVSTRTDWNLMRVPKTQAQMWDHASIKGGTHGVISTPGGLFVGPMGLPGLRVVNPYTGKKQTLTPAGEGRGNVYFYRAVALRDADRKEFLACAVRQSGVAAVPLSESSDDGNIQTLGYEGWDVVDVCAIAPGSLAVAAIGKDGTIRLFKNVLTDRSPVSMRLSDIKGTAYRVLSCRGHLFVQTSKQLCFLNNLIRNYLQGQLRRDDPISAMLIPMEAVDMNLYGDRYLFVVRPENIVLRIDIPILESTTTRESTNAHDSDYASESAYPVWDESEMVEGTQSLTTIG
jgi:hypothetical protein